MKDKNDKSTIDMFQEEPEERVCLVRAVETPDGVILHSKYQHDCVVHIDENGVRYQLDGGTEGFGSCSNLDKCKNLNLYYGDDHEEIREWFVWGQSFDKDMVPIPFRWVKLKDMTNGHVEAVMDLTAKHGAKKEIYLLFVDEYKFRRDNDIVVVGT